MGGQFRGDCYLFDEANIEATVTLMSLRLLDGDVAAAGVTARIAVAAIQSRPLMRLGAIIVTRAKLGRENRTKTTRRGGRSRSSVRAEQDFNRRDMYTRLLYQYTRERVCM